MVLVISRFIDFSRQIDCERERDREKGNERVEKRGGEGREEETD